MSIDDGSVQPALLNAFLLTTKDALMVFEAARRGICPVVTRRLQDSEKASMIRSGSVFAFDEHSTGIKRWTDGALWSPSRIIGNFLVYRELDKKGEVEPDKSKSSSNSAHISPFNTPNQQVNDPFDANAVPSVIATVQDPLPANRPGTGPGTAPSGSTGLQRDLERALIGSLTSSYKFKRGGLVKKTISNGNLHLICYYSIEDVIAGRLRTPSSLNELASLEISSSLLNPKSFRIPPLIEYDADGNARYVGEEHDPVGVPSALPPLLSPSYRPPVSQTALDTDSSFNAPAAAPVLSPQARPHARLQPPYVRSISDHAAQLYQIDRPPMTAPLPFERNIGTSLAYGHPSTYPSNGDPHSPVDPAIPSMTSHPFNGPSSAPAFQYESYQASPSGDHWVPEAGHPIPLSARSQMFYSSHQHPARHRGAVGDPAGQHNRPSLLGAKEKQPETYASLGYRDRDTYGAGAPSLSTSQMRRPVSQGQLEGMAKPSLAMHHPYFPTRRRSEVAGLGADSPYSYGHAGDRPAASPFRQLPLASPTSEGEQSRAPYHIQQPAHAEFRVNPGRSGLVQAGSPAYSGQQPVWGPPTGSPSDSYYMTAREQQGPVLQPQYETPGGLDSQYAPLPTSLQAPADMTFSASAPQSRSYLSPTSIPASDAQYLSNDPYPQPPSSEEA